MQDTNRTDLDCPVIQYVSDHVAETPAGNEYSPPAWHEARSSRGAPACPPGH
jgi:hypothetical protein